MKPKKVIALIFALALATGLTSCWQERADQQIKSAQSAIEEARAAEAPEYAPEEFMSAEEHLAKADERYGAWRFKQAYTEAQTAEAQARLARDKAEQAVIEPVIRPIEPVVIEPPVTPVDEQITDVFFAFDSNELSAQAKRDLDANAQALLDNPGVRVVIEGHCDDRGTEEYNLALGTRRANAVRDYLVMKGVSVERISTISYGEMKPFAIGHTEADYAKNRRAHFVVEE